mgnify:CR=1 FL=1
MAFLAQNNFAEMPIINDFPEKGILQFYVANNGSYGFNYDNINESDIKVIFIEEIDFKEKLRQGEEFSHI